MTFDKPKGVLAVDRESERAWVYDLDEEHGTLNVRVDGGAPLVFVGRMKAAEDGHYAVVAVSTSQSVPSSTDGQDDTGDEGNSL